jgi:PKD repeat protein
VSYNWNFGDGSAASTAPSPSHVYTQAGSFTAVLTVTDNRGATGTSQVAITVSPNPSVLNAPTNLTGDAGKGSATLAWTDNSTNEIGFYVERAPSGSSAFTRIGSVAANVKTFRDTVTKGNYVYRVQAFNTTVVSAYSNTVTVRVR